MISSNRRSYTAQVQLPPISREDREKHVGELSPVDLREFGALSSILNVVRCDLEQDADGGWDGLHVVTPFDVLHALDHEHTHHDQGWAC